MKDFLKNSVICLMWGASAVIGIVGVVVGATKLWEVLPDGLTMWIERGTVAVILVGVVAAFGASVRDECKRKGP